MLRRVALLFLLSGSLLLPGPALAAPTPATVKVRAGDTLFGLAQRHGLSVARLRAYNALKSSLIRPGQVLRLRPAASDVKRMPVKAAAPAVYTVKAGDTLGAIAERAGVGVSALRAANGIAGSLIRPGQKLRVPQRGAVAKKAAPPPRPPRSGSSTGTCGWGRATRWERWPAPTAPPGRTWQPSMA